MSKKNDKSVEREWAIEAEKIISTYFKSKGAKKMWNYFLDITKKEYFVETIKDIRKKCKIPENGFFIKSGEGGYYTMPPHDLNDSHNTIKKIRNEIIEKICKKYKLHYFDYSDVLLNFICYNKLFPLYELGACGLFRVSDIIDEKEEPFGELFQQSDDMAYPIAIRISPYASQRDIIDFIKNKSIWKREIEFLQNKYKDKNIKIGKIKTKNKTIQERNELIYNHKNKHLKEIRKILTDKNIFLDDGHIAKIISLEKQKRKEV